MTTSGPSTVNSGGCPSRHDPRESNLFGSKRKGTPNPSSPSNSPTDKRLKREDDAIAPGTPVVDLTGDDTEDRPRSGVEKSSYPQSPNRPSSPSPNPTTNKEPSPSQQRPNPPLQGEGRTSAFLTSDWNGAGGPPDAVAAMQVSLASKLSAAFERDGPEAAVRSHTAELDKLAYYAQLESIRRPSPMIDPGAARREIKYGIIIKTGGGTGGGKDAITAAATAQTNSGRVTVHVPVDVGPRTDTGLRSKAIPSYGLRTGINRAEANRLLRYQSNVGDYTRRPGPGHECLDLDTYCRDVRVSVHKRFPNELDLEQDSSVETETLQAKYDAWDPRSVDLVSNLPLVEEAQFACHVNSNSGSSCYWAAMAALIYGSEEYMHRVRAEHGRFFGYVLASPGHARHQAYTELNKRFFETRVTDNRLSPFCANLYQIMATPYAWTPEEMMDITADLYNVYIVCISTCLHDGSWSCDRLTSRGCYNVRHIAVNFQCRNHFRPMVPNTCLASEFAWPRITLDRTQEYTHSSLKPREVGRRSPSRGLAGIGRSTHHAWRTESAAGVPPALAVNRACVLENLVAVYWYLY